MKVLPLTPGSYSAPAVWEPMGQSPGNTPIAKVQAVQTLVPFLTDPEAGINAYELVKTILQNGPLENAKGVQYTKDELAQKQQAAAMAQLGSGPAGPIPGNGGGAVPMSPPGNQGR